MMLELRPSVGASAAKPQAQPTALTNPTRNKVLPRSGKARVYAKYERLRTDQQSLRHTVQVDQYHVAIDPTGSDPTLWLCKIIWVGKPQKGRDMLATALTEGPINCRETDEDNLDYVGGKADAPKNSVTVQWLAPYAAKDAVTSASQRAWLEGPRGARCRGKAPFSQARYALATNKQHGYNCNTIQAKYLGPQVDVGPRRVGKRITHMKLSTVGARDYSLALETLARRGEKFLGDGQVGIGGQGGDDEGDGDDTSDSDASGSTGESESESSDEADVTELAEAETEAETESAPAPAQPAPVPKRPSRVQLARRSKRGALAGAR
jgi:hypothetical protein